MSEETAVQEDLQNRFPSLRDKIRVARARRLFVEVPLADFTEVFDYAVKQGGFSILCAITGVDRGDALGAIYHVARVNGVMLNLSVRIDRSSPVIQSVTPYFPAAQVYEREMIDLLGIQVRGLPPGSRYPLPDDWPKDQFPLRKDWNPEVLKMGETKDA